MGRRRGGGFSILGAAAKSGALGKGPQELGLKEHMAKQKEAFQGLSGSGTGFRGVFNKTAQITRDMIQGGRKSRSFVEGAAQSNPALAQSLKIAKEKAPQQKKKPLSLANTVTTPKKKLTGAKPASAVAGALGSSSGGSVRL